MSIVTLFFFGCHRLCRGSLQKHIGYFAAWLQTEFPIWRKSLIWLILGWIYIPVIKFHSATLQIMVRKLPWHVILQFQRAVQDRNHFWKPDTNVLVAIKNDELICSVGASMWSNVTGFSEGWVFHSALTSAIDWLLNFCSFRYIWRKLQFCPGVRWVLSVNSSVIFLLALLYFFSMWISTSSCRF